MLIRQLLLQLILILVNAFFAATEIAVISLNEKKVKAQAEDGDKKAVKMLKMIEEPTGFLSTIQVGITLAGFLGSAFAADNFAEKLSSFLVKTFSLSDSLAELVDDVSVVIITIVLSFFTLVLGELVPKRLAMKNKEKLAEAVCPFISGLAAVLKPIVWFLSVSTNGVLRLCGIDPNEKEETVSEEDIVLMLDAGEDEGSIDQDNIEYIKNIFKLDDMTAEEAMTPRKSVVFVSINSTEEEILKVIENEGYSRIPVFSDSKDNIVGVLYARDYLLKHRDKNFSLKKILHDPVFVPESIRLDVLFKDMQKDHNHIAIVVDEYGETSGIVTLEDILEELVGEIWDELDEAVEEFKKIGEDKYRVLCSASIDEFFERFELESDEEIDATTVNGWLSEKLESIPEKGYTVEYENLEIKVTKANDLMAEEIEVKVNPITTDSEEEE